MLAVHFRGNSRISLDQVDEPKPFGGEVVVQIKSAAICGTDRENLEGPGQVTVPGHESAGEVVAVDKPTRVQVGDRVAINCHVTCGSCVHCLNGDLYFCDDLQVIGFDRDGGFAEYVRVPESCCTPIPDHISYEAGSLLVDMFGTPFRAAKRAALLPGNRIGIWGAGPIGLGELLAAQWFGTHVAIIDPSEYRRRMANNLKTELVLNPDSQDIGAELSKWTRGRGVDVAFDCVGSQQVAAQALSALKKRGTMAVVGVSHSLELDPWEHLICRELTVFGTRNFNTAEFGQMVGLLERGLPVEQVVTHKFRLSDAEDAFDLFRSGDCGKILFVS